MKESKRPKFGAVLALWTLVLVAPHANASEGGNGSGGGKGFICPDNGTFKEKIYLADTYSLRKSGELDRVPRVSFSLATQLIDKMFPQKLYPHPHDKSKKISLGTKLAFVRNTLYFQEHSFANPPDYADDNIDESQVPVGCRKVQVALQDISNGYVRLREDAYKLANGDWLYLELHETLIALRNRPGADTTEIRAQVAKLAKVLSSPEVFSKEILSKLDTSDKQDSFKTLRLPTLYRMPMQLTCVPTWNLPRGKFQARDIKRPQQIILTRISGDGRVGEDSQYQIDLQHSAFGLKYRSTKVASTEASLSTETDNPATALREHGVFDFSAKFKIKKTAEIELSITAYDLITKQFLGQYDVFNPEGMRVVHLNSGNGIACSTLETPVFKHDERSSTYGK